MYTNALELLDSLDLLNVEYPTPDIFLNTITGDVVMGFSNADKALSIVIRPAAQYNSLISKIYGDPPVTEEIGAISDQTLTSSFEWLYS